jgi:hypothetical protein
MNHQGVLRGSLGDKRLATVLRRAQRRCAAACDSCAQQHDGSARFAIGGRQWGDATGRHAAALAEGSRRGLARIAPAGGSVGAEEGDGFGRVSGTVAGRARNGFYPRSREADVWGPRGAGACLTTSRGNGRRG